jgi:hypothetical protein
MRDAETYGRYATECERIVRTMTGEHRKSLLAIAEAWRELAREAQPMMRIVSYRRDPSGRWIPPILATGEPNPTTDRETCDRSRWRRSARTQVRALSRFPFAVSPGLNEVCRVLFNDCGRDNNRYTRPTDIANAPLRCIE